MFDIAYVHSNCDYEYSSDEKYLDIILDRYDDDDKELLKLRTRILDSILEKGIDDVKSFVTNLSKSMKNKIDDDMKDAYLALFKEVIMLDENVATMNKFFINCFVTNGVVKAGSGYSYLNIFGNNTGVFLYSPCNLSSFPRYHLHVSPICEHHHSC